MTSDDEDKIAQRTDRDGSIADYNMVIMVSMTCRAILVINASL